MDWSKAKNILIVALIATNIFLLGTYLSKNNTEDRPMDQETLFAVLQEKHVYVDTDIPDKYDNMPAIAIQYSDDKQDLIEAALKKDVYRIAHETSKAAYKKMADRFLKDCQMGSENLLYDGVITSGDTTVVRYKNSYKNVAIGDSFMEVSFEKGRVKDVTRQRLTVNNQSKKKLKVTSPEEALLMFMSEKDPEEMIHVENIQLVFWVNTPDFNGEALVSDTAFPAWEITYNQGQTKYIDAYKA